MSVTTLAGLILGSTVVGGLITAAMTWWIAWQDRQERSSERSEIRKHEALLRRELAHDEAREVYRPMAQRFQAWVDDVAHKKYNDEVDFGIAIGTKLEVPADLAAAVDQLRLIRDGHPTRTVRERARKLVSNIEGAFFDPPMGPNEPEPPSFDQAMDWSTKSEELIEAIHFQEEGLLHDQVTL